MNKLADRLMRQALQAMEAARPANGRYPVSPEEVQKTLRANVLLGKAMFVKAGMSEHEAEALSRAMNDGPAGRLMLELSVRVAKEREREEADQRDKSNV